MVEFEEKKEGVVMLARNRRLSGWSVVDGRCIGRLPIGCRHRKSPAKERRNGERKGEEKGEG